jgi:hypothetical protein
MLYEPVLPVLINRNALRPPKNLGPYASPRSDPGPMEISFYLWDTSNSRYAHKSAQPSIPHASRKEAHMFVIGLFSDPCHHRERS